MLHMMSQACSRAPLLRSVPQSYPSKGPFNLKRLTMTQPASAAACQAVRWDLVPPDWVEPVAAMLPLAVKTPQLDGIDCFAGEKGFCKAMLRHNLAALPFEKNDDPEWEDVLTAKGLSYLFFILLRVRAGGLVMLGPPCKFWIFLTLSHTKRTRTNPAGSSESWMAMEGNAIADVVAKITKLCAALMIYVVIEQPHSSFMFQYPPMAVALRDVCAKSVTFNMAAFKHPAVKPTRLWGTAPWLEAFGRCARMLPVGNTKPLADRDINGGVTGRNVDLTASAAYTDEFCNCLIAFHLKSSASEVCGKRKREVD